MVRKQAKSSPPTPTPRKEGAPRAPRLSAAAAVAAVRKTEAPLDTTDPSKAAAGSRSIARTCAILRLLAKASEEGESLINVSAATGLPKSSAHRYLQVLEEEGFAERDIRSSNYRLGAGIMALHASHIERLVHRSRSILGRIRDRFDETVNLAILVGHEIIYLEIVESSYAMRLAARKGDTEGIHATALGKAIAATLSDREVLELLNRSGMPKLTPNTITTPEEYLRELGRVREAGYAIDDQENEEEGRCVAVYIPGISTPTAISMSGVASRFSVEDAREVAESLRIAAIEIGGENIPEIRSLQARAARS